MVVWQAYEADLMSNFMCEANAACHWGTYLTAGSALSACSPHRLLRELLRPRSSAGSKENRARLSAEAGLESNARI